MATLTTLTGLRTHGAPEALDLGGPAPILAVTGQEVEERTGMTGGPDLVQIHIEDERGLLTRFWVSARMNKRGQPVVSVSTPRGSDDVVRKSVTGTRKNL